jgi:hypothetical protein
MPDAPNPDQPAPEPPLPTSPASPAAPINFNIGDEFGTAKRNLPPAGIVLIAIAIVAAIVGIVAFRERPRPQGSGSIRFVTAVEIPGQKPAMTLAAITFTLRNSAEKPLWIRSLKAQLTAAGGHTYEDEAASAVDLDRYYQLFPALKESSEPPLSPETKLPPGTEKAATIMVTFPIAKETFDQRKFLVVSIQPYDQPMPVVLK